MKEFFWRWWLLLGEWLALFQLGSRSPWHVPPAYQLQRNLHDPPGIQTLGPLWSGHRVSVKSDSEVATTIVNKGSTPCPLIIDWLRELFLILEYQAIHLTVDHSPGSSNVIPDSISRLDEKCHKRQASRVALSVLFLSFHMPPFFLFFRLCRPVEAGHGAS